MTEEDILLLQRKVDFYERRLREIANVNALRDHDGSTPAALGACKEIAQSALDMWIPEAGTHEALKP